MTTEKKIERELNSPTFHEETKLKQMRVKRGLSQKDLASASGVSLGGIRDLEQRRNDINNATVKTVGALATALSCNITDLIEL